MKKLEHKTSEETIESRTAQAADLTVQAYLLRLSAMELKDEQTLLTIPEVREMLTTLAKYTERLRYYLADSEHYNKSLYEYMFPNS